MIAWIIMGHSFQCFIFFSIYIVLQCNYCVYNTKNMWKTLYTSHILQWDLQPINLSICMHCSAHGILFVGLSQWKWPVLKLEIKWWTLDAFRNERKKLGVHVADDACWKRWRREQRPPPSHTDQVNGFSVPSADIRWTSPLCARAPRQPHQHRQRVQTEDPLSWRCSPSSLPCPRRSWWLSSSSPSCSSSTWSCGTSAGTWTATTASDEHGPTGGEPGEPRDSRVTPIGAHFPGDPPIYGCSCVCSDLRWIDIQHVAPTVLRSVSERRREHISFNFIVC